MPMKDHVSWSHLKEMARSPLAYKHSVETPREDTAAFRFGRALHCAVLEPGAFEARFVVYPGPVRRGKEWEAFAAKHCADEIITADEKARAWAAGEAVRSHPAAGPIISVPGEREITIEWDDDDTGLHCLARIDLLSDRVVEVKSTSDIDPHRFCSDSARLLYHAALAWYQEAALATGRALSAPPVIVSVESDAPHDVIVWDVPSDILARGEETWRKLLKRVAECQLTGRWPGASDTPLALYLPKWAQP